MDAFRRLRGMLSVIAAVSFLAGCAASGSSPLQQGAAQQSIARQGAVGGAFAGTPAQLRARGLPEPSLAAQRALRSAQTGHHTSWMSPGAAKSSTLLYVADEDSNDVYVYEYPSGKLVGTLTGFNAPSGICSNKAGDVFILNGGGSTVEVYAHGATSPLRTLDLPGYPELNCSVDPKTGNLAVPSLEATCGDCIAIFQNAQGTPTLYTPSGQEGIPGCGYDDDGNLFCDAFASGTRKFELFELARGSSTLTQVSVDASSIDPGPLQWDGEYLAVGSGSSGTIYQIQLSGTTGSVEGQTQLDGTGWVWQFWIPDTQGTKKKPQATTLIAPTYAGSAGAEAAYWKYPAGGNPTKAITGFQQPDGAALSKGKS